MYAIRSYYALSEYPAKTRATMGVLTLSRDKLKVTGPIAAARVVNAEDDLTIISSGGIVLRRITSYNVCYTKLLRSTASGPA